MLIFEVVPRTWEVAYQKLCNLVEGTRLAEKIINSS